MVRRSNLFQDLTVKPHTIKPGTPEHGTTEHGTPAERRNNGTRKTSGIAGTPRNNDGIPE